MKKILLILLFVTSFSIQAQFRHYDSKPIAVAKQLTVKQKAQILDAYAKGKNDMWIKHHVGVEKQLVVRLRNLLNRIDRYAFNCMSGTLESEAPKTVTQLQLLNACLSEFNISASVMTAIINKKIAYSKKNGSGTFKFYLSQFEE